MLEFLHKTAQGIGIFGVAIGAIAFPFALFKSMKHWALPVIVLATFFCGASLWIDCAVLLYTFWGFWGFFLGCVLAGVGVYPLSIIALAFAGHAKLAAYLAVQIFLVLVVRTVAVEAARRNTWDRNSDQSPEEPATPIVLASSFRRWVARCLDYGMAAVLLTNIVLLVIALTGNTPDHEVFENMDRSGLWGTFGAACWLPIESLLLWRVGTTPGKWLLAIRVRTVTGSLSLKTSFLRAVSVWMLGTWLMLPLVSLVAMFVAANKIGKTGSTTWDASYGTIVTKERTGRAKRFGAFWIYVSVVVAASVVGQLAARLSR